MTIEQLKLALKMDLSSLALSWHICREQMEKDHFNQIPIAVKYRCLVMSKADFDRHWGDSVSIY